MHANDQASKFIQRETDLRDDVVCTNSTCAVQKVRLPVDLTEIPVHLTICLAQAESIWMRKMEMLSGFTW
jgi:hypothetical protein